VGDATTTGGDAPPGRSLPRLGFAVGVLGGGGLPSRDARRWASRPHLSVSLDHLGRVLDYLEAAGIDMYRMSSNLAPYETHPDHPEFHGQVEACADALAAVGARARRAGLRLSMHPGQYTVLNSEDARVRAQAIAEVSWQARLLDAMGLGPEAVIVIHVGSAAPDHRRAADRFLRAVAGLPPAVHARLVVENDDRLFGLGAVLRISRESGVPVVWDAHHHRCHDPDGIPEPEALDLALGTWRPGVRPKIHFSTPRTALDERVRRSGRRVVRTPVAPSPRSHADLIDPFDFARFRREVLRDRVVDVMLEAKGKDIALLTLRRQLDDGVTAGGP
jgi:UV DNA damage endonuclease